MVKTNVPYPSVPGKKQTEICIPPVIGIFESLVDWRKARGKVYPLSALLLVVLAGLMCGKQSLKAIARWCAELCFLDRARLGLPLGRSPGATTLGRLLAKLDPVALERAMKHWLTAVRRELRCAVNTDAEFPKITDVKFPTPSAILAPGITPFRTQGRSREEGHPVPGRPRPCASPAVCSSDRGC